MDESLQAERIVFRFLSDRSFGLSCVNLSHTLSRKTTQSGLSGKLKRVKILVITLKFETTIVFKLETIAAATVAPLLYSNIVGPRLLV